MKTISLLNLKGGVGKTSCAVNLAAAVAASNQRTLIIDLDPQGSATDHLAGPSSVSGIAGVLMGACRAEDAIEDLTTSGDVRSNLFLIPSGGFDLSAAEVALQARASKNRLRLILDQLEASDTIDFAFLDTGPGLDFLWYNALYASDMVICPVELQMAALQGLRRFQELLAFAREEDRLTPYVYYLPTSNDGRLRESRDLLAVLHEQFGQHPDGSVLPSIRYSSGFSKSYAQRRSLLEYSPKDRAVEDCKEVSRIILSVLK